MGNMNGVWLISYLALWLLVIFALVAVLALARQIGLLHRRLSVPSARMESAGPEIGELVPELAARDLLGRKTTLGGARGKQTLLAFVSPRCISCDDLAPALRSVWKSEHRTVEVILVGIGGDEKSNRDFIARHALEDIPFLASNEIGTQYRVLAPPYALLIDKDHKLLAKGVVNHMEHLESLLNVARGGYPSIDAYLEEQYKTDTATALNTVS